MTLPSGRGRGLMRKTRAIIAAVITVILCQTNIYANQSRRANTGAAASNAAASITGQVTITNVDGADSSKRLNGARIKIVDKDSGEEYTDIIKDGGKLIYPLPLGGYTLTQVIAPENYQLNSKIYDFTLQVPQGLDTTNIKIVNASVMMTNDLIGANPSSAGSAVSNTPTPAMGAGNNNAAAGAGNNAAAPTQVLNAAAGNNQPAYGHPLTAVADKNPVTADNSNILLAILIFSFIITVGGLISRKYLIKRL